jgi:hypothetical protein
MKQAFNSCAALNASLRSAAGVLIVPLFENFPAGGPRRNLSSRQYSALNKDYLLDDVFIDPKLLVINKIIFWVVVIVSCG